MLDGFRPPLNYNNTKVTLELRELVNSTDANGNPVNIWDFTYPSYYTGAEKAAFEQKVIDHYYFRQLGSESVGRWLHQFRSKIREIMPYYIKRYESVAIMEEIDDPFGNVDITDTYTESTTDTQSGSSSGTATTTGTGSEDVTKAENETLTDDTTVTDTGANGNTKKYSDTPQGSVSNITNGYLTNLTVDDGTSSLERVTDGSQTKDNDITQNTEHEESSSSQTSGTSQSSGTGSKTYSLHRKGNHGVNTYAHDMKEYRDIILNVDMEIINELNDLFLLIY